MIKKVLSAVIAVLLLVPFFSFAVNAADGVISVGKSYTVEYYTPVDDAFPKKAYKEEKKLTDGKVAKTNTMSDSAWTELYRGTAVQVTVDLGEVMAVSGATLGELQYRQAGIWCSRYLEIYVSENGTDFGLVGRTENKNLITQTQQKRVEFKLTLDKTYKARYVRAVFSSDVFTYVDELSIYGSSDVSGAVSVEKTVIPEKEIAGDIDGIKSICLMYTATNYTPDVIKPYFAYIDKTGKAVDTMFDSMLFLGMPVTSSSDGFMRQNDMKNFVSVALGANTNISALDTVVGEMKGELGLGDDFKYPIFFSVPNIGIYSNSFGEIDGKNVSSNSLSERSDIVKWYIDYVEEQFNAREFENVTLKGFYWFSESIDYALSTYESDLVAYFNDYSHGKGYKTMWIPFYSAAGIDEAKDLGFDSVTMQSGHAFEGGAEVGAPTAQACKDAATTVKRFGLNGLEFEVDCNVKEYAKRFEKYVSAAYGAGLMEKGMITMYQVGDHLYRSSKGTYNRGVYDLTYEFISGQYTECAPVIEGDITITVTAGDYVRGKFVVKDEDTNAANLQVINLQKIEGLYIEAYGNGRINIEAAKATPGTYETTLAVTDGSNVSNTIKVTVIVVAPEGEETTDSSEQTENSDPVGTDEIEESDGMLFVILLTVGIVAVAAVIAFVIVKVRSSKRK
ncbi:MAG: DUF4855 domain-containing protein [Clostridia bacterium]|nr:DUF4855 domain-containing protein [Clostridia bacterium]